VNGLVQLLAEVADDPGEFARIVLGVTLYPWQKDITDDIARRLARGERRIKVLVRAAHNSGKSFLSAVLLLWFMSTRAGSRGLVLGPKWQVLTDVLFGEIRALHAKSLLGRMNFGRCTVDRITFDEATWFATAAASDQPATLEGQHSLVGAIRIVDEGRAVDDAVYTATEGVLASRESVDLWISTAGVTLGRFYRRDVIDTDDVIRRKITIDQCVLEGIPGAEAWRSDRLRDWGEGSIEYRSRALSEYVADGEDQLYPTSWIEHAQDAGFSVEGAPVGGLDPAGSTAGDATAFCLLAGPDADGRFEVRSVTSWRVADTQVTKGRVLLLLRDAHASSLAVDVIGLGQGLKDSLALDFTGTSGFRSSDRADDPTRFQNRKAEVSWELRCLLEAGKIALPRNDALRREMLMTKYVVTPKGAIRVVDPPDSPDNLDALLIALSAQRKDVEFRMFFEPNARLVYAEPDDEEEGHGPGDPLPRDSWDDMPPSD
jgi:hypothetical protein